MKRFLPFFYLSLLLVLYSSCKESRQEAVARLVNEWNGKEILFPSHSVFTRLGKDTVDVSDGKGKYCIVSYVDSIGCISCKLQLPKWKELMRETDSLVQSVVTYRFYFHPKDLKELAYTLRRDRFDYPVCIDLEDEFNGLNCFPQDMTFQTFLLDSLHRVVAVGNPVHNAQVKELYVSILTGERRDASSPLLTQASLDKTTADLGEVSWEETQSVTFELTNTGKNLLVIYDADTSCGCVKAEYGKEPARPGEKILVKATYKADNPARFDKTISLHCNVADSPIRLRIRGRAK